VSKNASLPPLTGRQRNLPGMLLYKRR